MDELRVVVIVSADRSDLYFANQLIKHVNVVGVIVENQHEAPDRSPVYRKILKLATRPHVLAGKVYEVLVDKFRKRFATYNQPGNSADFGKEGLKLFAGTTCEVLHTPGVNDINAPENIAWLRALQPDVVAVCGASIFRDEIISVPDRGVLNLHGGLSQKYRGLFTTDWAVYNEEPEYVGATVHFIAPGIDDGDIVYQGRPEIDLDDNPNSLYVKVVRLGVNMMVQAVKDIENGSIRPTALQHKGDLYLGNMFTPGKRDATWKKLRKGVIADYLRCKETRDKVVLESMINHYRQAD
jgi:methionyl-tRNA formyltransferase